MPPEDLVKKMVPILCKIVGIGFIVFGTIFLPMGCIFLFMHGDNSKLIGGAFIGGSILQIVLGIIIVKYVSRLMLGISRSLREYKRRVAQQATGANRRGHSVPLRGSRHIPLPIIPLPKSSRK
jgi:hypothetical protein